MQVECRPTVYVNVTIYVHVTRNVTTQFPIREAAYLNSNDFTDPLVTSPEVKAVSKNRLQHYSGSDKYKQLFIKYQKY